MFYNYRRCGHGGTGRRVMLRSLSRKEVEVQVLLAAPFFELFLISKKTKSLIILVKKVGVRAYTCKN